MRIVRLCLKFYLNFLLLCLFAMYGLYAISFPLMIRPAEAAANILAIIVTIVCIRKSKEYLNTHES